MTHRSTTARAIRMALLLFITATANLASADTYPSKAIKLVVPFSAGGSSDLIARRFAERLSTVIGQSVVIENRAGAASNIGSAVAQAAAPDGYTLLLLSNQLPMNQVFGPKPAFDVMTAIEPVAMIARLPFIVAASTTFPFNSISELLPAAKAQPKKFTIGSAQLEVLVELMHKTSGATLTHVPYRGGAETIIDTVAGRVDMTLTLGPVLLPQVRGGKLKPLGIAGKQRLQIFPGTRTFQELGVPYEAGYWYGIAAPAGTPKAVIERLAQESRRIVESPAFVSFLSENGGIADSATTHEMRKIIRMDLDQWQDLAVRVPTLVRAGEAK